MNITCDNCGAEYILEHIKFPFKDSGSSVECKVCGRTLYRWGKGTDDYHLIKRSDYEKQLKRQREIEQIAPYCRCGIKMELRYGKYGNFWGCKKYPNGCNQTINAD